MYAREWKAPCPKQQAAGFIGYLHRTGIKDTTSTPGFNGAQIFGRELADSTAVTLISIRDTPGSIKAFAGADIGVARLYSKDHKYALEPDDFLPHYEALFIGHA